MTTSEGVITTAEAGRTLSGTRIVGEATGEPEPTRPVRPERAKPTRHRVLIAPRVVELEATVARMELEGFDVVAAAALGGGLVALIGRRAPGGA